MQHVLGRRLVCRHLDRRLRHRYGGAEGAAFGIARGTSGAHRPAVPRHEAAHQGGAERAARGMCRALGAARHCRLSAAASRRGRRFMPPFRSILRARARGFSAPRPSDRRVPTRRRR